MLRALIDRLRGVRSHDAVAGHIAEELRQHEDLLAADLERAGRPPQAAREEARRRLGSRARWQDEGYDVRGGGLLEALVQDVRYGARRLLHHPTFTIVAVLTLALGIGANTAIFSVANGVLLRPLPYPNADRLSMIWMDNTRLPLREDWHSYPDFQDYRDQSTTFDMMAVFNGTARTLTGEGEPDRLIGAHNSAALFPLLGVPPLKGRVFTDEEETSGAAVVVISAGLWQRQFGGRDDAIEKTIELNGRPTRVIGVMPPEFVFPARETQFWVPTPPTPQLRSSRGSLWLQVIGRRKPGVTVEQAQSDLARVNTGILDRFPAQKGYGVYVVGYHDQIVGRVRPAILVLLGAVGFVLLIACTNVANLLLARAATREREMALRVAIGAGRGRLIRQLFTESALLGLLGGAGGIALGWLGLRALVATAPADLPRLDAIAVDPGVLAFTLGLSLLTGVLFGMAPALQLARADPGRFLKEGGRGATGAGRALRRGLVVVEAALAVVLLVGAGLMIRSFIAIQRVDLGMRIDQTLSARIALLGQRYQQPGAVTDFFAELVAQIERLPGVEGAAAVGSVFLSATPNSTNFSIEGRADFAPDERVEVPVDSVTPTYFDVMGVPLRAGRSFDARDGTAAPPVVIINDTMARQFWPDEDPIGRRIKYGQLNSQAPWMTVVGVVADTRRTGYESAVRPETYRPHAQGQDAALTLVIRTTGDPEDLIGDVRRVVRALDPMVAVQAVRPLTAIADDMTAQRRLNTLLLVVFAGVAAVLAGVGVYGVMAYSVQQRTRELGVRVALGAAPSTLLGSVLTEGLWLVGIGLAVGLAGAVALGRAMTGLLYEVPATDPLTLAGISVVTIGVAGLASAVPALRAMRLDPVAALRSE
jgi:putative ABC transport system permease protein